MTTTTTTTTTAARNATLEDMKNLLEVQQADKLDLVVPATAIRSRGANWIIQGADSEPTISPEGELGERSIAGEFRPTAVADEHVGEKLGVPVPYLRRLRNERPDLYDANVNGLLQGRRKRTAEGETVVHEADARKFLVRTFRGHDGEPGVARALLSDRFRTIDNLDCIVAALEGVSDAGVKVDIDGCDLSDNRMYVRLVAPEVAALAPSFLKGYRSPWGEGNASPWETARGQAHGFIPEAEQPVVFAGLVISNSETGGGAFSIAPRIMVKVCHNGLVVSRDAVREVHLGGKLDEGIVRWGADTQRKALELVTAKTRDAVATFLDVEFVTEAIARMEAKASVAVTNPTEQIKVVTAKLGISKETADSVLAHFIRGGQLTVGGIAQAVSSVAQTVSDADAAADLESAAVKVFDLVLA